MLIFFSEIWGNIKNTFKDFYGLQTERKHSSGPMVLREFTENFLFILVVMYLGLQITHLASYLNKEVSNTSIRIKKENQICSQEIRNSLNFRAGKKLGSLLL